MTGVTTDRGERLAFDALIANSDIVRSHQEFIDDREVADRFERRRAYEPACSGVVMYLGLSRRYPQLLHHNFVFSRDPEEEFDFIYRQGEPAPIRPATYAHRPLTDPTVAPEGGKLSMYSYTLRTCVKVMTGEPCSRDIGESSWTNSPDPPD